MQGNSTVRLALVAADDETRLLIGLATECDPRYELVRDVPVLDGAVPELLHEDVDVVIVDHLHDDPDNIQLLARLRAAVGKARVVVITHDDHALPTGLVLAAGADAFLSATAFRRVTDALQLATGRLHAAA